MYIIAQLSVQIMGTNSLETHKSFEILKTIIDHIPVALFVKSGRPDNFGEFLLVNKVQEELLKIGSDRLLGKTDADHFPAEQAAFFRETDLQTFANKQVQVVEEEPLDTPSGRRWLHTRKYPIFDEQGQPDFLIGVSEDITERKEAHDALERTRVGLRTVVYAAEQFMAAKSWRDVLGEVMREIGKAADVGRCWLAEFQPGSEAVLDFMFMWERRDDQSRWKPEALQNVNLSGLGFDQFMDDFHLGHTVSGYVCDLPTHPRRFLRMQRVASYICSPLVVEGRLWGLFVCDQEDERREWTNRDFEIMRAFNSILVSTIERDVSSEELRVAETKLRHAQRMETLGQLAGGIAHDFNNMLTSILGYTRLAMDQIEGNRQLTDDLQEVMDVGEQAAQLARQMLVLSRKHEVEVRAIDVNEAVRNFDHMFRRALEAHIELITILDDSPVPIHANQDQIELVLMNLSINARDAMSGGGKLWVKVESMDLQRGDPILASNFQPGGYACLSIQDTGEGISPQLQTQIFEPFFTTKEMGKGTGLGLSTTKQIVEQYSGFIHLDSEAGTGTTFRLLFPLVNEEVVISPGSLPEDETLHRGDERILVVEDEATLRALARRILERLGYSVLTASSGSEALHMVLEEETSVDLILSDVVMPHMSGPEMIRRLQERGRTARVLFMSGYTGNNIDREGFRIGENQLLAKPFTRTELAARIREMLDDVDLSTSSKN